MATKRHAYVAHRRHSFTWAIGVMLLAILLALLLARAAATPVITDFMPLRAATAPARPGI